MADDKNLATLKMTVTADKNPLKKALDSARQDTEKSTSRIQGMLQGIRKMMSSVSLMRPKTQEWENVANLVKDTFRDTKNGTLLKVGIDSMKQYVKETQVLAGIRVRTDEYEENEQDIERTIQALERLKQKKRDLHSISTGNSENADNVRQINVQIQNLERRLEAYQGRRTFLQSRGDDSERAYTGRLSAGNDFEKAGALIRQTAQRIQDVKAAAVEAIKNVPILGRTLSNAAYIAQKGWGGLEKLIKGVGAGIKTLGSGIIQKASGTYGALLQRFSKGIPLLNRFTGGVRGNSSAFGGGLKTLLKYSLGIRSLYTLVNKLRSALVDGFKNLSQYSGETNKSLSMLMSSLTQLKNSFAAAFAPILNIVAPILNAVIQKIISVVNAIGQLTSALTGGSTFIKAKHLNQNYAASLDKNTKSANKANDANKKLQKTLLGFDQINKLDDTSGTSSTDSAATGGLTGKDMFETFTVSNEMKALSAQIKEAWKNADFTEIGRIVGRKLNSTLQNIPWTPIQDTCNRMAKSVATFLNGFIEATNWNLVGNTLALGINTIFGIANSFAENFNWGSFGNAVGNGINGALDGLDWNLINETVHNIAKGITDGLNGFIQTTDWGLLGQSLGNGVNTVIEFIHTAIENFDWLGVGNALSELVNSAIQTVDFADIGDTFSDGLKGLLDFGITAIEGIDWYQLGEKTWEGISSIDWNGIADRTFELIGAAFGGLAAFLGGVISEKVQEAKEYFQEKIEECGGNVVEGIFKGIIDGVKGIGSWIKAHIFDPFIKGFKNAFGIHSPSTVMAEQGSYIISGFLKGLKDNIDSVLTWIGKIPGRVTDKLSDAKKWLVETGENVLTGLKNGLNDKWSSVGDWFKDLPGKISDAIPNLFDIGKNAIQNFVDGFGSVHIPLPHISTSWNHHSVGPVSFSTPSFSLKWYAKGGFPDTGEMFMARENGPELVGRMGNKNAVANNNQIISGIRAGVYEAVVNALESRSQSQNGETDVHIYLEGDTDKLFKVMRKKGQQYQKSTGKPVFS